MISFVIIGYHQEGKPIASLGIILRSRSAESHDQNIKSFAEQFPNDNQEKFLKGGVKKGDSVNYWYFPIPFSMN